MKVDKTSSENQMHIKPASQTDPKNAVPRWHAPSRVALQAPPHPSKRHGTATHIRCSENAAHACSPLRRASISRTDRMLTERRAITTPTHSNQILSQGELKALWVMSSRGKRCSISRARPPTVLGASRGLSWNPLVPTVLCWVAMLSSHLHYTSKTIFFEERIRLPPPYLLTHVEKGEERTLRR